MLKFPIPFLSRYIYIVLGVFLSLSTIAQVEFNENIQSIIWPKDDKYSTMTDFPDKYEGSSAVILYQKYFNQYIKNKNELLSIYAVRRRIKILDRNALNAYSEFSFDHIDDAKLYSTNNSAFTIGKIKLIKQNGNTLHIDLSEAVEYGENSKKIAIPNLELGDILDYYYFEQEEFDNSSCRKFDPIISTLGHEYPILHQDIEFKLDKSFYLNLKTINGAPQVEITQDKNNLSTTYLIQEQNQPTEKFIQWFYPNRDLPSLKFQVSYVNSKCKAEELDFIIDPKIQIKQSIDEMEVLNLAKRIFQIAPINDEGLDDFIYENDPKSKLKQIELAYNYLRFYRFVDLYEKFMYASAGLDIDIWSYGNTIMNDRQFLEVMGGYLVQEKIPFQIMATLPRKHGILDDLVLSDELIYLIKVNLENPVYLSRFTTNTTFNSIPFEIEGQQAFAISIDNQFKPVSIEREYLPNSNPEQNSSNVKTQVNWDSLNLEKVNVQRLVQQSGNNKDFDREELLTIYNIILEEEKELDLRPFTDRFGIRKSEIDSFNEAMVADLVKTKVEQKNNFNSTTSLEYEFEIQDYRILEIANTGRWFGEFEYQDQFSTSDLVHSAGKNFILDVGQLLGKQIEIPEDQMTRTEDVNMAFARSFSDNITLNIPPGYQVLGLEKLNVEVENKTGGFVASASLKEGKLKIQCKKYYSHNYEKAENWPLMQEFLEEAYKFSRLKILLKKQTDTAHLNVDR